MGLRPSKNRLALLLPEMVTYQPYMNSSESVLAPEVLSNQRLLITGITGTLGRHVLEEMLGWPGVTALALVRPESSVENYESPVEVQHVNFSDWAEIDRIVCDFRPTVVIHCAAAGMQIPRPPWAELVRFNVDFSVHLCEMCARVPDCQFVYVSTALAYRCQGRSLTEDDPFDTCHPYAAGKAAADILVRATAAEFQLPLTVVRPFSFSGTGDTGTRLFPSLLRAAATGEPFALSPGHQLRDHCAVSDIARGIVLAVAHRHQFPASAQVFNLGSGSLAPLKELVQRVVSELELQVELNFGARSYAPFEPRYLVADISRAAKLLGWRPTTNFSYAIWELARASFPQLKIKKPVVTFTTEKASASLANKIVNLPAPS